MDQTPHLFFLLFLPIAILYIATGVLYLFDIEGGVDEQIEYTVSLPKGLPNNEQETLNVISPIVQPAEVALPADFYLEDGWIGWYGYKRQVYLEPSEDKQSAILHVKEHDLWHQFLLIHKGHAGPLFWFSAIMLGASLLFSLISGLVVAFAVPKFRKAAVQFTSLGFIALVVAFFIGG
ncbi:hypothetical protein [Microbulbifer sp. VAAF005]|uniref:hypothetical protein n=1 Tax=Microbulbifer sp. VAAF005 TaxID=3034230 RepID=UPI0024AD0DA7|nr:hypothetical protein [Microbulbifer sp. VAAF005]WHI47168.1 hypothetical protein P0078_01990 [Microbulbifer sp. VAAF005]